MTIAQQKEIVAITRRALAMLDPGWNVTVDLQDRLARAMLATTVVASARPRKIKKAELYTYRPFDDDARAIKHVEPEGKVSRTKPNSIGNDWMLWIPAIDEPATCLCAACQVRAGFWARGMKDTSNIANDAKNKIDASAVRESLKVCACSHDADRHEEDELNNLLKCSDCDCEQFHYQNDQKQAA